MTPVEPQDVNALRALMANLLRSGQYSQTSIAKATGINQSIISRLLSGDHTRMTRNLSKLYSYAIMQSGEIEIPESVLVEVRSFLIGGGNAELMVRQLRLLGEAGAMWPSGREETRS